MGDEKDEMEERSMDDVMPGEQDAERSPVFEELDNVEELYLCYSEMKLTAEGLGMNPLALASFANVQEGIATCKSLYADIQSKRAENLTEAGKKQRKEKKTMARTAAEPKTAKKATAPKKAPAKKTAAPKATSKKTNGEARMLKYNVEQTISWIGDAEGNNPSRAGTGRHERMELVRKHDGKTVGKYMAAGGRTSTLSSCEGKELIKIA